MVSDVEEEQLLIVAQESRERLYSTFDLSSRTITNDKELGGSGAKCTDKMCSHFNSKSSSETLSN